LATEVAFVVIMRVMVALFVVVVVAIATAWLAIFGVVAALLVGVFGLVAMDAEKGLPENSGGAFRSDLSRL
jgi:hypothetical protein